MTALAVVSLSARMLAEAAVDDGFEVVALDLFGDADTRRASAEWHRVGDPASLSIDGAELLSVLKALAQRGSVAGWIAGSGFEGRPDLLESGAALLPQIGTRAGAMRRVRDPQTFFGFLDARGIAHPMVRMTEQYVALLRGEPLARLRGEVATQLVGMGDEDPAAARRRGGRSARRAPSCRCRRRPPR